MHRGQEFEENTKAPDRLILFFLVVILILPSELMIDGKKRGADEMATPAGLEAALIKLALRRGALKSC